MVNGLAGKRHVSVYYTAIRSLVGPACGSSKLMAHMYTQRIDGYPNDPLQLG